MELGTSGKTKVGKLIYGGYGLGKREDGSAVFIPNVVPGEIVEYEIDGSQGGIPVGRVVRIVDKSTKRRDVPCEYAGECGGCDWGHLEYDEQVRRKKEIFLDCIDRIGKFDRPQDIEIFTAAEFGYRMRAQAKVDHQNKSVGFYRKKTNEVIKVIKCPLLVDEINDVLAKLNFGMMSGISNDVKTIKILAGDGVASYPVINGLTGAKTEVGVDGVRFLVDGGSFFQSNRYLLKALGRWAGGIINGKTCFDLYGGIGFFSMMLADNFTNIILVENIAAQVRAAERNFLVNGKKHCKAVLADVEKGGALDKLAKRYRPDCIIVDPPRPGLVKSVRKWLIDAAPSTILYVSCNPSTFARDAGALVNGGYKLSHWALFDLYPNTHHIESAAVFLNM